MHSSNSFTGFRLSGASALQFKLATLTFNALHTGRRPYLIDRLQHHQQTRSCSSSSHQLFIPRHNLSCSRAFSFSAPRIFNCLSAFSNPSHFPLLNSIWRLSFSSQLTPPIATQLPRRPDSLINFGAIQVFDLLTYLLTYFCLVWPWPLNFEIWPHDTQSWSFYNLAFYRAMLCVVQVCLSVCLSVTRQYSVETVTHTLKLFTPSGSHTILVFANQTVWQYFYGDHPLTWASNATGYTKKIAIFD